MSLGILAFAVMFGLPLVASVFALTGATSPGGFVRAVLHAGDTGYAADMESGPAPL